MNEKKEVESVVFRIMLSLGSICTKNDDHLTSVTVEEFGEGLTTYLSDVLATVREDAYEKGQLDGFKASGEGCNGEYLDGNGPSDEQIRSYLDRAQDDSKGKTT